MPTSAPGQPDVMAAHSVFCALRMRNDTQRLLQPCFVLRQLSGTDRIDRLWRCAPCTSAWAFMPCVHIQSAYERLLVHAAGPKIMGILVLILSLIAQVLFILQLRVPLPLPTRLATTVTHPRKCACARTHARTCERAHTRARTHTRARAHTLKARAARAHTHTHTT